MADIRLDSRGPGLGRHNFRDDKMLWNKIKKGPYLIVTMQGQIKHKSTIGLAHKIYVHT